MYYKLENDELEKIKQVEKLTCTDYDLVGDFIPGDSLMSAIEDLLVEIHNLQEKVTDLENDIENNYKLKNINPYDEYGVNERDFL